MEVTSVPGMDGAGGEPELGGAKASAKDACSKVKLRSDIQAGAQVLTTTRRLPELSGCSGKLGVGWSLAGAEEDDGGDAVQRGVKTLGRTRTSEWS